MTQAEISYILNQNLRYDPQHRQLRGWESVRSKELVPNITSLQYVSVSYGAHEVIIRQEGGVELTYGGSYPWIVS